jgi:hypothetical protein
MRTTTMLITFYGNKMRDPREVGRTNNKVTSFVSNLRHVRSSTPTRDKKMEPLFMENA